MDEIPGLNWFDEPIKNSINSVFDGMNEFVESLDLIKRYRSTHFEILAPSVRTVKILGMQQPIDLAKLYYPTHVSIDIRRRIYKPDWVKIDGTPEVASKGSKTAPLHQRTFEPADKFIEVNHRTVVLGGPGAGKTTFLKYLALAYCDKAIFAKTNLSTSLLPIYLHLPALPADGLNIISAISAPVIARTEGKAEAFYRRLLETGNIVLLLDSLDEVPAESRAATVQAVSDFAKLYPKTRIIISCRTADYQQVFDGFAEVEIARLSKEAVTTIVGGWFSNDQRRAEKLLAMLESDPSVASLTETPLLLGLLCIQYRNDLALPKRKTELYRRCVDALLRDWDTSRNFRRDSQYSQLSDDRKEMIFENIAGATSTKDIEYEFSEPTLLSSVSDSVARFGLSANDAKGILVEIESHHGIVEKCSAESYQFSHGTMHEYFIARYYVERRQELQVLKDHFDDDRWHTVIPFMCAIVNDPGAMLEFLVANSSTANFKYYPTFGKRLSHLLLLYRCMSMGVAIQPALRSSICDHLIDSQIHLIAQLNKDRVLPYASRRPHGVRQRHFYYSRPRPSIDKLLVPYRSLMNEICLSPLPDYAEKILRKCPEIWERKDIDLYGRIGLITCLLCPIADAKPQEFMDQIFRCSSELLKAKAEGVRGFILESISVHQKIYPEITAKI